jgi:hypothetical protein
MDHFRGGTLKIGGPIGDTAYDGVIQINDANDYLCIALDKNGQAINVPAPPEGEHETAVPFLVHDDLVNEDILTITDMQSNMGGILSDSATAKINLISKFYSDRWYKIIYSGLSIVFQYIDNGVVENQVTLRMNPSGKLILGTTYGPIIISGTPGASGNLAMWNADNDLVDGGLVQDDWGYIQGAAANYVTESVTFPVAYDAGTYPIVKISSAGVNNTGAPSNLGDTNSNAAVLIETRAITDTGFDVYIFNRDAATNLNASWYYLYTWSAKG